VLAGILLWLPSAFAKAINPQPKATKKVNYQEVALRGEFLAAEIARTTGYALNPLICVATLGAYQYYTTPEEERSSLPWHAAAGFWGPLTIVLAVIFLKDSSKVALPKLLTIPLDALETLVEKNTSALIALPVLFSAINNGEFTQLQLLSEYTCEYLFPVAIAGDTLDMALNTSTTVIMTLITYITILTIYIVVWVVSQAFTILILLCPFSTVDMFLATGRNSILAVIIGLGNTYIGMTISIFIVLISLYLFPKALRLVVFGTIMSYDLTVTRLLNKTTTLPAPITGIESFASRSFADIPPLTYGKIQQNAGTIEFTYRRFYFFEKEIVNTGICSSDCELINGLLSPVLKAKETAEADPLQLFRVRSKYSPHNETVTDFLGVSQGDEPSFSGRIQEIVGCCQSLFKKPPKLKTNKLDSA
jgi:hypothetical protein